MNKIFTLITAAFMTFSAQAAEDMNLNVSETVAFGEWGFDNSEAPALNVSNWSAGGGWQFDTPLSQDDYCGVDFTMEPTIGTHVTFTITFEGGETQNIDVPEGTTAIKTDFVFNGGITKIGFSHGDWEGGADPAVISITSAVVKVHSTGKTVELDFDNLGGETKDESEQSVTFGNYNWSVFWSFDPAILSDDYEKIIVTFSEPVPVDGLTINAEVVDDASWCGSTLGNLTKGATKATAYFSALPGATITRIGFLLDWQAESATLKIDKVELVKKSSSESDGIYTVNSARKVNEAIYTLSGQQVGRPVKGINIINGKKFVIK